MLLRAFSGVSFSSLTVIVLLLVLNLRAIVNAEEKFCPEEASVDLTNAKPNATGFLTESGHFFSTEIVRNEKGALRGCMCDVKPCVPLCPSLSKKFGKKVPVEDFSINLTEISMFRTTSLTPEDSGNFSIEAEEQFYFFTWDKCMFGHYYEHYLGDNGTGEWYIFENGSLFSPRRNDTNVLLDWRQYCLRKELNYTTYISLICLDSLSRLYEMVLFIGALISVPLIITTIFVYSVLPQLKNIHGKTLSCYLGCLLVMNISHAIEWKYLASIRNTEILCPIFEFIEDFSVLASFLWLNVMCFDMWRRFGGYGSIRNNGRIEYRKKLIGYSIYAWGTAVVMSAICFGSGFILSISLSKDTSLSGIRSCWCGTWQAISIYFALIFLSIICNTCFFVSTSIKLIRHQRNSRSQLSSGDSKRHDDNELQLLNVNLKLFVIMGIGWSALVIGMFWKLPIYVAYFINIFSETQGIPIFVVLVCKKKIWQSLKMRFNW